MNCVDLLVKDLLFAHLYSAVCRVGAAVARRLKRGLQVGPRHVTARHFLTKTEIVDLIYSLC